MRGELANPLSRFRGRALRSKPRDLSPVLVTVLCAPVAQGTGKLAVRPRQAVALRRPLESLPLLPDPRFLGASFWAWCSVLYITVGCVNTRFGPDLELICLGFHYS